MALKDLIFVSMENWDDIWRRNQFLCAGLARRHPEMKILFVGLAKDVSNRIRRGKIADLLKPTTYRVPGLESITVTHPLKFFPKTLTAGRKVNEAMFRRHVAKIAKKMGMIQPVLWLNPHSAVHMVCKMGESGVIYDITDDWTALTQSAKLSELIRVQDAELCQRADSVIVCSQRLYEMKTGLARDLHLIPNGVDADHYGKVSDADGALPAETAAWPRPIYGYTGSIHPDRVDVELIAELARRIDKGSIVLIGPNLLPPEMTRRLTSLGNIFLPGSVPYAKIPEYMRAFDVSITPHQMSAFTESLNPIKLWEYLAAGKPIVSTDVAGFRDYPEHVYLARTAEDFLDALVKAQSETSARSVARRALARQHSWEDRLDQVEKVISTMLGQRRSMEGLGAA